MSKNNVSGIDTDLDKRLKETESCYNFEKLNYKTGLLDETVDVTYIIHLEGNGRYENILKQLEEYKPTQTVYILLNKGFKCSKKGIKTPSADLTDCYLQIFKHAKRQNLNNILILEDDFIFNDKIKDPDHIKNVNDFLTSKEGDNFIYILGALPWFLIPYNAYNYRPLCLTGTHSIIYSKAHRDDYLLNYPSRQVVTDWDVNYNINFTPRFIYYTPLCYQLFTDTENSRDSKFSNKYVAFASDIVRFFNYNIIYRILGLDKNPEPGFSILYFFAKLIFYLVVLALLYTPFILYYVYNNFDTIKDYAINVIQEIRSRT
jgi:hypothetical protein